MKGMTELTMLYALCDHRGRFIYEVAPHIFPYGHLSQEEIWGWEAFNEFKDQMRSRGNG